jgi:psp operon transcriptional activator
MKTSAQGRIVEAIGQSEAFLYAQEQLSRVAPIDRPVLIIGERGTGKELAALRVHFLSPRWQEPFVALDCASLNPSLLESELFGHETGAFTGASHRRKGRFEMADGGTLFLDEIGSMPRELQEKILRVVEYKQFSRVGSSETITVDVRIIGATNEDLPSLAQEGKFRRDLLDRLAFEVVTLPPLHCRDDDIALLARHFASQMAVELGLANPPSFTAHAISRLKAYAWPGNVRECKNVVERAVSRFRNTPIDSFVFDPFDSPWRAREQKPNVTQTPPTHTEHVRRSLRDRVKQLEIASIRDALSNARFNQKEAARALGLSYDQFRGLYRKYSNELETLSLKE